MAGRRRRVKNHVAPMHERYLHDIEMNELRR